MKSATVAVKPVPWLIPVLLLAQGCVTPGSSVREVREIVPAKLEVRSVARGAMVYTDRDYTMEEVPAGLEGAAFVATPCDMKRNASHGVRFKLAAPAVVYVGYQSEDKVPPGWLTKNFEKTPLRIGVHQPENRYAKRKEARWHFDLYRRACPAGLVAFGPNAGDGMQGNALHYIVVLEKNRKPADICFEGPVPDAILGTAANGVRAYIDRAYVLKNVPGELAGAELVVVRQADSLAAEGGREIRLSNDAFVYAAYDASSKTVPEWIAREGFEKKDFSLSIGGMGFYPDRAMDVYGKECNKGDLVRLGANRGAGWSGWPMQYLVMIKARIGK